MLRVFLVEDESLIRETLRDTMPWENYGYIFAGEAADGEIALPLIREAKPDVLITDVRMPFMDGLALSRLVLSEFPDMKVVILSGYDDFEYAQQAIDIGVDRYLLKPVTKNTLIAVLEELRGKIEEERAQQNFMMRFRSEAQDYEQYARRRFFEQVISGSLTLQQTYEQAERLDLDLRAQVYNIALFTILPEKNGAAESYSEPGALVREALVAYFLKYPEYILFRWNISTYAVLIKGELSRIEEYMHNCVRTVKNRYETLGPELDWYVAVGTPTPRLSMIKICFDEVSRLWAYRHILPRQHILTKELVNTIVGTGDEHDLAELDVSKFSPSIIARVLRTAGAQEIFSFVDEYVNGLSDALSSAAFCQYLMLSARFTATEFVCSLGCGQKDYLSALGCLDMQGRNVTKAELKSYIAEVLSCAVEIRDQASKRQYRSILKQAVDYIDKNFSDEQLSLNRVAREVNISANYLSALFSQELGDTFVEYVTAKRMEQAKLLLRTTELRSGEVAAAVGFKDPHYFSFLFKKTQGCTPRDYRAGKVNK